MKPQANSLHKQKKKEINYTELVPGKRYRGKGNNVSIEFHSFDKEGDPLFCNPSREYYEVYTTESGVPKEHIGLIPFTKATFYEV